MQVNFGYFNALESEQGQPPSNYVNASYIQNIYGIR